MRSDPASDAIAVTLSDTTVLSNVVAFMVGTTGDVKVTTANGNDVVIKGVVAGVPVPLRVVRIWSTGTTALNVTAFIGG